MGDGFLVVVGPLLMLWIAVVGIEVLGLRRLPRLGSLGSWLAKVFVCGMGGRKCYKLRRDLELDRCV